MEMKLQNNQILTILCLCLCLHGFFLLIITTELFPLPPKKPFEEKKISEQEREEWVALNGNGFGAPVLFESEMENEKLVEYEREAASFKKDSIDMITHENQKTAEKNIPEKVTETPHAIQTALIPQQEKELVINNQLKPKEDIKEKSEKRQIRAIQSPPQDQLTFSKLANGFMQYMQNPAHITVVSKKKGNVSDKQIARMNFEQKLLLCIVNSYRINKLEAPRYRQRNRAAVAIALNRDGSIYALELIHSSGNPDIDRFILAFFKDTNGSFPNIPQQFSTPYYLPVISFDDVRLFQSPQYWHYDVANS